MKQDFLFKNLIKALNDRIPQRGRLAEFLTELLGIEKEAVYRRLRGSVPFSFQEVYIIALKLGFSLDSIAVNLSPLARQMTALAINFPEPQEKDYKMIEDFILSFRRLKEDPDAESGAIASIIPSSLYVTYEHIYKFSLFKWSHQFWSSRKMKSYDEIKVSDRTKQFNKEHIESIQESPKSVYILNRRLIEFFVNDILFFFDIRQIIKEDVLRLKEELHLLINKLEHFAMNGCFDNGNKVEIYLSNVFFETSYYYIDATNYKLTMMRSLAFNDFYSFDEAVFNNMKNWLIFLKRTSTLISEGNVTERIRFFDQQRKLVDSL